jgi:hypothetical protein
MNGDDIEVWLFRSIPVIARIIKKLKAQIFMRSLSKSVKEKKLGRRKPVNTPLLDSDHDPLLVGATGTFLGSSRVVDSVNG